MADKNRKLLIAVCGAGACDPETAARAEAVGKAIAEAGAVLICGGLGGVMEAAAKGAHQAGGTTVGILPGPDIDDANPWIQVAVATDMAHARNAIIVRTAHAVIAVGGAYGTLSEIALALKMGKPVVSLQSWEISQDVHTAPTPQAVVSLALKGQTR